MEQEEEIRARIAELRQRYAKLKAICNSWAKISPETLQEYLKQIRELQKKLE